MARSKRRVKKRSWFAKMTKMFELIRPKSCASWAIRVLEAVDGPAALATLEANGPVDLLFTDVVLPGGMTGSALAKKAAKLQPGIKTLFTTGYARNAIVHHGRLDPGVDLLTKPFSYADLAARVRDILDRPGEQP